MPRLDLSITTDVCGESRLAARIRRDTLVQLALGLRGDRATDVQNALDALIDAVESPADAEGAEIDALCDDIESEVGVTAYQPSRRTPRPLASVDGSVRGAA